jgi:hypothetical protein
MREAGKHCKGTEDKARTFGKISHWLIGFFILEPLVHAWFYRYKEEYVGFLNLILSGQLVWVAGVALLIVLPYAIIANRALHWQRTRGERVAVFLVAAGLILDAVAVFISAFHPGMKVPVLLTPLFGWAWVRLRTKIEETIKDATIVPTPATKENDALTRVSVSDSHSEPTILSSAQLLKNPANVPIQNEHSKRILPLNYPCIRKAAHLRLERTFQQSALSSRESIEEAYKMLHELSFKAGIARFSRFPDENMLYQHLCFSGRPPNEAIERIRHAQGVKRILISAISVAPYVVLKSLKHRYDLDLDIDFSFMTGQEIMESLPRHENAPDCIITAAAPFLMNSSNEAEDFQLLLPCCYSRQNFFRHANYNGSAGKIFILAENSAEATYRCISAGGHPFTHELTRFSPVLVSAGELFKRVKNLDRADAVILWDPVDEPLQRRGKLERVAGFLDQPPFYLALHKKWFRSDQRMMRYSFASAFIAEWNFCLNHREYARDLIEMDVEFLQQFAMASCRCEDIAA